MARSAKRGARAKSARTRGAKDLTPRSGRRVTGGRQTPKTDFGSVVGRGISKAADVAANTQQT
jgi:hypothetical protein